MSVSQHFFGEHCPTIAPKKMLPFAVAILFLPCPLTPVFLFTCNWHLTNINIIVYMQRFLWGYLYADTLESNYCKVFVRLLLCFNKWTLYAWGQTANISAKPCGLNFHRLGLPLILICAYPRPQRVRFTDCGAKVFPVLVSATSTEVLQSRQCLGCIHVLTPCYMQNYYVSIDDTHCFCLMLWCRPRVALCYSTVPSGRESGMIMS